MSILYKGYTVEIDTVTKNTWTEILRTFDDANIYQTWSYGAVRWGEDKLSHLVLKRNGNIVAASQVRLVTIPLIHKGIAYVRWGPLWRFRGNKEDPEVFLQMVRALRNEYVIKRGFFLRLLPCIFRDGNEKVISILNDEGYKWISSVKPYRTFLLDLSPSLDELRENLIKNWRRFLKKAEQNGMEILEGTDDGLYEVFNTTYNEMLNRKRFVTYVDINQFRIIQKELPDDFKMRIMICKHSGKPNSANICSAIGDTCIGIFGATNNDAIKFHASYLIEWEMVKWLKERNYRCYDLGGIDPDNTPGTYHFKKGLSGKNGKDVQHIGQFDACDNIIIFLLVTCGDVLRAAYRNIIEFFNKLLKRFHIG